MSVPFENTLRSAQRASIRPAYGILGVALTLLLGWIVWGMVGSVPLNIQGRVIEITGDGMVIAEFEHEAAQRMQPGQVAILRFAIPGQSESWRQPARLVNPPTRIDTHGVQALFAPQEQGISRRQLQGISGSVQISVPSRTPAQWLLSTFISASASPQRTN